MNYADLSIHEFLRKAASSDSTPGGGGVAAIAGALAVSMASMVANLTIGKERYIEAEEKMQQVAKASEQLIVNFLQAAEYDAAAYQGVMDAYRMPKDSPDEQEIRHRLIQRSLLEAAQAPLRTAQLCRDALGMAALTRQKGNPLAVSDALVALHLGYAALLSAVANIDANLELLADSDRKQQLILEKTALLEDASKLMQREGLLGRDIV